jgi:hypothetical protein
MVSTGAVPTAVTIVEVVNEEGMTPLLKLAAESNSICGDIRRRRSAILWLKSGGRTHEERREDVAAPVVGSGVTTGRWAAGDIGCPRKEWEGKGEGRKLPGKTGGWGGTGGSNRDTRCTLMCANRRAVLHKGSWIAGGVMKVHP